MFDQIEFVSRIREMITTGHEKQAERELMAAWSDLTGADDADHRIFILSQLAQFYSLPMAEDLPKAESYFLECEALSPEPHTLLQTAMFYFYVSGNFPKTIAKVDEIKARWDGSQDEGYYSALTIKGQALIELGNVDGATFVLEEMLAMIKSPPARLPYGDELNLLSAAISRPRLAERSREILALIISRIRSPEYVQRARSLLETQGPSVTLL
ncbi:MAG: hypothetical protein ACLQKA_07710 [Bryobacteraceae bacterium]